MDANTLATSLDHLATILRRLPADQRVAVSADTSSDTVHVIALTPDPHALLASIGAVDCHESQRGSRHWLSDLGHGIYVSAMDTSPAAPGETVRL